MTKEIVILLERRMVEKRLSRPISDNFNPETIEIFTTPRQKFLPENNIPTLDENIGTITPKKNVIPQIEEDPLITEVKPSSKNIIQNLDSKIDIIKIPDERPINKKEETIQNPALRNPINANLIQEQKVEEIILHPSKKLIIPKSDNIIFQTNPLYDKNLRYVIS